MKVTGFLALVKNPHTFELGSMTDISQKTVLRLVKYILDNGNGTLGIAVRGRVDYYTWNGVENAD